MNDFIQVTNNDDGKKILVNVSFISAVWDCGDYRDIVTFETRLKHSDTFAVKESFGEIKTLISEAI